MRYFIVCLILILSEFMARGQSFNYTASVATESWQELNAQTILNTNNSAWNFSYMIPIGFTFNYLGRNFDSLTIETNGYIVFDDNRNYALTAFLGFSDCVDTNGDHSVLGYELSGTPGNHLLKIQFKNLCSLPGSSKYFSYQVWLRENNALEIHVGPNDFQPEIIVNTIVVDSEIVRRDTIFTNIDSMQIYRVGLLNMNMDAEISGFFIGGTPSSPLSQPVNENYAEPIYMMRAPSQGTRYTFTPNPN